MQVKPTIDQAINRSAVAPSNSSDQSSSDGYFSSIDEKLDLPFGRVESTTSSIRMQVYSQPCFPNLTPFAQKSVIQVFQASLLASLFVAAQGGDVNNKLSLVDVQGECQIGDNPAYISLSIDTIFKVLLYTFAAVGVSMSARQLWQWAQQISVSFRNHNNIQNIDSPRSSVVGGPSSRIETVLETVITPYFLPSYFNSGEGVLLCFCPGTQHDPYVSAENKIRSACYIALINAQGEMQNAITFQPLSDHELKENSYLGISEVLTKKVASRILHKGRKHTTGIVRDLVSRNFSGDPYRKRENYFTYSQLNKTFAFKLNLDNAEWVRLLNSLNKLMYNSLYSERTQIPMFGPHHIDDWLSIAPYNKKESLIYKPDNKDTDSMRSVLDRANLPVGALIPNTEKWIPEHRKTDAAYCSKSRMMAEVLVLFCNVCEAENEYFHMLSTNRQKEIISVNSYWNTLIEPSLLSQDKATQKEQACTFLAGELNSYSAYLAKSGTDLKTLNDHLAYWSVTDENQLIESRDDLRSKLEQIPIRLAGPARNELYQIHEKFRLLSHFLEQRVIQACHLAESRFMKSIFDYIESSETNSKMIKLMLKGLNTIAFDSVNIAVSVAILELVGLRGASIAGTVLVVTKQVHDYVEKIIEKNSIKSQLQVGTRLFQDMPQYYYPHHLFATFMSQLSKVSLNPDSFDFKRWIPDIRDAPNTIRNKMHCFIEALQTEIIQSCKLVILKNRNISGKLEVIKEQLTLPKGFEVCEEELSRALATYHYALFNITGGFNQSISDNKLPPNSLLKEQARLGMFRLHSEDPLVNLTNSAQLTPILQMGEVQPDGSSSTDQYASLLSVSMNVLLPEREPSALYRKNYFQEKLLISHYPDFAQDEGSS